MKKIILLAVLCTSMVISAGCTKKNETESSGEKEKISYGTEIYDQKKIDKIIKEAQKSKKLSADEAKEYQKSCVENVKAVTDKNEKSTKIILESISKEFGKLLEVTPDNYGEIPAFAQFAIDCTYLDLYMEKDSVKGKAGKLGLDYVSQVLQGKKEYKETLEKFRAFFSEQIEELFGDCFYPGEYVVGKGRMKEGEYVLFTDNTEEGANYTVYSSEYRDKIVFRGTFFYDVILTLDYGEFFELESGCKAVSVDAAGLIDVERGTMFKVGTNLKAGTYRLKVTGNGEGRYLIYPSSRPHEQVKEEKTFKKTGKVTVKKGDYLILEYCHIIPED